MAFMLSPLMESVFSSFPPQEIILLPKSVKSASILAPGVEQTCIRSKNKDGRKAPGGVHEALRAPRGGHSSGTKGSKWPVSCRPSQREKNMCLRNAERMHEPGAHLLPEIKILHK